MTVIAYQHYNAPLFAVDLLRLACNGGFGLQVVTHIDPGYLTHSLTFRLSDGELETC